MKRIFTLMLFALLAFCFAEKVQATTVTLPFTFDSKSNELVSGMTQSGLGDYSSSPYLKFGGTGDWLTINVDNAIDVLTFAKKGNGTNTSSQFHIQTSIDGSSYTNFYDVTPTGSGTITVNNFPSNVRHIRFYYTKKDEGNFAIGDISISKVAAPATPYTVSFNAGAGTYNGGNLTESAGGAGINLPAPTLPQSCTDAGWSFAGWTTATVDETNTAPTALLNAGDIYKPSDDCTLYAVYSMTETSGSGTSSYIYLDKAALGLGTYPTTETVKTVDSVDFGYVSVGNYGGDYIQFQADNGKLYNKTSVNISKIWVSSQTIAKIYFGTSEKPTENEQSITVSNYLEITPPTNSQYFIIETDNSAAKINYIQIEYGGATSNTTYNSNPDCGTSSIPKLATPTNLTVSDKTADGATISWDAVDSASSYKIVYIDMIANSPEQYINNITTTSYTFSGLDAQQEYLCSVVAVGDGTTYDDSEESESQEITFCDAHTVTFQNDTANLVNGKATIDLSSLFTSNSSGSVTYDCKSGDVDIEGINFSTDYAGTYTVTATQAAYGDYCDATATATITISVATVGDGTKANPYTVADVIALNNPSSDNTGKWVQGYIIGFNNNGTIETTAGNSNLVLCATNTPAASFDNTLHVTVQLPRNTDVRTDLNIEDNPSNIGREVKVKGNLEEYFKPNPGVKNTSEYEFIEDLTYVAPPVFDVEEGIFSESFSLTLTCETAGATIYYTLDGTEPDATSEKYSAPIAIPEATTTVKAIAVNGAYSSIVNEATYTYKAPVVWTNIEDFELSELTTSYADGSFVGNDGITWTYVESRDKENASGISGKAIMLRRSGDGSKVTSAKIAGGIGNFSVKLYKGFTGGGNRQVEVFINGISKGKSIGFDDTDEHIFTIDNINVSGNITIEVRNITSKQVIVDDISWTSYESSPVANIAAFNAKADTENEYIISGAVTVVYQNGGNLYIQDNSGSTLIYDTDVTETYSNGDVLTGMKGLYSEYNDLPQITNVTLPTPTRGTAFAPTEVDPANLTAADGHRYVRFENVEMDGDVTFSSYPYNGYIVVGDGTMTIRNHFKTINASFSAGDIVNVEGFVNLFDKKVQLYITSIEKASIDKIVTADETISEAADYNTLTIESGAILTADATITASTLILESNNDDMPQVVLGAGSLIAQKIIFKKTIDETRYYFFSLPFDCAMSDITLESGNIGTYGTNWLVSKYDEEIRATEYTEISAGTKSEWVDLQMTETLAANRGYIMVTDEEKTYVFTKNSATTLERGTEGVAMTVTGESSNNKGWNLISLPAYQATNKGKVSIDTVADMVISRPNASDGGATYNQALSSEISINPFTSFFVQTPIAGSVSIAYKAPSSAPSMNREANEPERMRVYLDVDGEEVDKTTISLYEAAEDGYWVGYDVEKMSSYVSPQIYTNDHGTKLAFNARESQLSDVVSLGLYLTEGTYTLRIEAMNGGAVEGAAIMDGETGVKMQTHTFTVAEDGYVDARFTVEIDRVPTDVDGVEKDNLVVYVEDGEVVIDGLNGNEKVMLLSASGQMLSAEEASSASVSFRGLSAGVYLVKIGSETYVKAHKVIIK